jgi:hypothetical protein
MKRLFLIASLIGFSLVSNAQIDFKFGVKGGVNMSKMDGGFATLGTSLDTKALTSGHFGVLARLKVLGILAVQPEVLYSMQGVEYEGTILGFSGSEKLKTDYIQVPVMLKFYPMPVLNIQVGPQVGFLTKAKFGDEDVKDDLESTYYAVNMGLGLDLPLGIGIDARYSMGVSDIHKDFEGDKKDNRMNMFTLSLSYCF